MDTSLFLTIAFWGIWPYEQLISVLVAQYLFKTLWEAVMYPVTAKVVGFLKRIENEDYYDRTDFNRSRSGSEAATNRDAATPQVSRSLTP